MITMILLIIIYLAFISLGLPDALLGVAWPLMQAEWNMALDAAGLIAFIITGSTILSSFMSGYIIEKFGTGKVTFLSCLMTGVALLGISFSPSYMWLLVLAIPLGLGAGSVDTALNNYVALHFKAHHMNWLHSFWGVGATGGPLIMAQSLIITGSWRLGYRSIAIIQLSLSFILLITLPLWKKHEKLSSSEVTKKGPATSDSAHKESHPKAKAHTSNVTQKKKSLLKIKGVPYALITFLFYCATEASVGLWGSSFLVKLKGLNVDTAAFWISMYYGGITLGRFISGFISFKLSTTQMIRLGVATAFLGVLLLLFPLPSYILAPAFVLTGLGLAPIFPAMIHATPQRFGADLSQRIIGYQMGFAYMGSAFLPPLFGILVKNTSMVLFPYFLMTCVLIMAFATEKLPPLTVTKKDHPSH